jgi:hypothetical protein
MERAASGQKIASLSKIRWRCIGWSGKASRSCCTTQAAVGCLVTLKFSTRRLPWSRTNQTYRSSKRTVGTTKKSIPAIRSLWFLRNVIHRCCGSPPGPSFGRYREIVVNPSWIPSFPSSAWILRARQPFSVAMRTIRAFVSSGIRGRPGPGFEIHRQ